MAFDPISLGVTLLGGLLGSKNKGETKTESNEPWAPAQPYLKRSLEDSGILRDYYQQNPFNQQQKTGYQNRLNGVDHFANNVAPGLLNFANNMTTGSYQMPQRERPGMGRYGSTQPADTTAGGLLSTGNNRAGPFTAAPRASYGQIDWNKQNPFYKTPEQIEAARVAAEAERLRQLALQQQPGTQGMDWYQNYMTGLGGGDGGAGADGSPGDGGGSTW